MCVPHKTHPPVPLSPTLFPFFSFFLSRTHVTAGWLTSSWEERLPCWMAWKRLGLNSVEKIKKTDMAP